MSNLLLESGSILNVSEALKHGIAGLGAIMAVLCFWLLRSEQRREKPNGTMMVSIYVFMFFSLILVALGMLGSPEAAAAVGKYAGYVVPHEKKEKVAVLPKETSGRYKLLKDISIFDLRGWKVVPVDSQDREISPANYINYLHIVKTQALDTIVMHYSTSGYDIDLRCITQSYKLFQTDTLTKDHPGQKSYAIAVDISRVPLNEEFLVVIEATYWNGFKDPLTESASTYTDETINGLNELDLIVLLPYDKPVKNTERYVGHNDIYQPYREEEKFYVDEKKKFVYWGIKDIQADRHYKLNWTW